MIKRKIIIIIGIIIIVLFFMLKMFISDTDLPYDKPIPHVALQIQLEKNENFVIIKTIDLVENYPEKAVNNYSKDFLEIQLLNTEGKLIAKMQKPTRRLALLDYINPDQATAPVEESVNGFIFLLPYQLNADTVVVKGDDESDLLTIKMKNYNFSKINLHQNLCGNGLCDTKENVFICYRDCSYQPKEFIDKIVP